MKLALAILCVSMLAMGCQEQTKTRPAAAPALTGSDSVDAFFRDELSRSGEWINLSDLGPCWYPAVVPAGWKPYTRGRWVYTDGVGWLWLGTERWSWACDHYGRWMFADSHGWVWVPGKQWSPAWVALRSGNGYIGWAPLPPSKGVAELDVSRLQSKELSPAAFSFVSDKFFLDPKLSEHLEPDTRNITLLDMTQDVTRYEVVDERLIHRGIDVNAFESARGSRVEHFVVVEIDRPRLSEFRGTDVTVYRPRVTPTQATPSKPRPINPDLMAWQRQRQEEYHKQTREAMDERHEKELASPPFGLTRGELEVRQARETQAFDDERRREIEALRRLQRDRRERFAEQQRQQDQARAVQDGTGPHKYEIPPEWQLPPEMMVPPAKARP